jgi:O-antigen ligase
MKGSHTEHPIIRLPVMRPEVFLALFVFAGIYKLVLFPELSATFDWTAAMFVLTIFSGALLILTIGGFRKIRFTASDVWLGLYSMTVGLGLLQSSDINYGMKIAAEFLLLGVLASYFLPRVLASFSSIQRVARNAQSVVIVLAIVTSVLTLGRSPIDDRAFAGSYLSWGYFLGAAIILTLLRIQSATSRMKAVYTLALVPLSASFFLSRARGPLISLGVILLATLFMSKTLSKRMRLGIGIAIAVSISIAPMLLPTDTFSRLSLLFREDKGASVAVRLDGWSAGVQAFLEHPLLGIGTGSFQDFHTAYGSKHPLRYPHNVFIGVAAESGVVGLILMCGFLVSLFWYWRYSSRNQVSAANRLLLASCYLVVAFYLIGTLFSGHLLSRHELLFAGMAVALAQQCGAQECPVRYGKGSVNE